MNKLSIYLTAILMAALIPMTAFADNLETDYQRYFSLSLVPAQVGPVNVKNWERDRAAVAEQSPGQDVAGNFKAYFGQTITPAEKAAPKPEVCDASCTQLREKINSNDIRTLTNLYFNS